MKIKDIINMAYNDIVELTKKSNSGKLQDVLIKMANVTRSRINKLTNSEIGKFSPAYLKLKETKLNLNKYKVKVPNLKDTGKMLQDYTIMKNFLKAKSSTLGGWNKIRTKTAERIGTTKLFKTEFKSKRQATYWINKEKKFWKAYNHLVDEYGGIISQLDSEKIQKMLYKVQNMKYKGKTDDDVVMTMEKYIDELYKAKQKGRVLDDDAFVKEVRINFKKI